MRPGNDCENVHCERESEHGGECIQGDVDEAEQEWDEKPACDQERREAACSIVGGVTR